MGKSLVVHHEHVRLNPWKPEAGVRSVILVLYRDLGGRDRRISRRCQISLADVDSKEQGKKGRREGGGREEGKEGGFLKYWMLATNPPHSSLLSENRPGQCTLCMFPFLYYPNK